MVFSKKYFNFLVKSTNAHGVHSPFVYDLVTKCFYRKRKNKFVGLDFPSPIRNRHVALLKEFTDYFGVKSSRLIASKNHGIHSFNLVEGISLSNLDFVYLALEKQNEITPASLFANVSKNGVVVIELPHQNMDFWNKVKALPNSQIVVDTFYFGFIFPRKIQAKEEFFIRI